jgi:UDP-N-acetylglucosamine transferase subunit ALG13
MIFVTSGTVSYPFKRLIDAAIDTLGNMKEKVIIQTGDYKPDVLPANIKIVDHLTLSETIKYYKSARLIISACGEASVFLILRYAKNIPIFVPRQKIYGEHVDNQQMILAKEISLSKPSVVIYDINDLKKHIFSIPSKRYSKKRSDKYNIKKIVEELDKIT